MATTYKTNTLIVPHLTGGLVDTPIESIMPNQTRLLENFEIMPNKLVRRNSFNSFNPNSHGKGAFVKSFKVNDTPYLLIIDFTPLGANKRGVISIYDKQGAKLPNEFFTRDIGLNGLMSYLDFPNDLDPKEVFSIAIHNNTLYILNNTIVVTAGSSGLGGNRSRDDLDKWSLYWVKETSQIGGGYKYYLIDNDYTGGGVNYHVEQGTDSNTVSNNLASHIGATKAQFYGNSFVVENDTSYSVSDSLGGQAFFKIWREVDTLEDLPNTKLNQHFFYWSRNDGLEYYTVYSWDSARAKFIKDYDTRIEPIESSSMSKETYPNEPIVTHNNIPIFSYVEVKEGVDDGYYMVLKNGYWQEEIEPDSIKFIHPYTMPLNISIVNGVAHCNMMLLSPKRVTSSNPAFIEERIKGIAFYKNRMVLVTNDTVTFSKIISPNEHASDDNIDFFKSTAKKDVKSDVFNIGISNNYGDTINDIEVFRENIFLIAKTGLYAINFQDKIVSLDTISITKSLELDIDFLLTSFDTMYICNKRNIYRVTNEINPIATYFKSYIQDIVDIAVSPLTSQLFMLRVSGDILVYKYELVNGQPLIMGAYLWTTHISILALEVVDNKLVIVGEDGIHALDFLKDEVTSSDNGVNFISRFSLPRFLERKNNTNNMWSKIFYRRIELFVRGDANLRIERDNLLVEETDRLELNIIQGNNMDTTLIIESIDDLKLDFYHAQLSIQNEQRISR